MDRDQLSPKNPSGWRLRFSRTRIQYSPGLSTTELPSPLTEPGAYSPDRAFYGTLAYSAAPCQAFRDSAACLSRATISRRAPNWSSEKAHLVNTFPNLPSRRRTSTDRLIREDSQFIASLEGEFSPTPAGKILPHSYPKTRFGGKGQESVRALRQSCAREYFCWRGHSSESVLGGYHSKTYSETLRVQCGEDEAEKTNSGSIEYRAASGRST